MEIFLIFLQLAGWVAGFLLFRNRPLPQKKLSTSYKKAISVIIPARNEENNLPYLLKSLQSQTRKADEIIVVDDHSSDRTKEAASRFPVRVLSCPELPEGWTGKNWAVWNGYLHSTGDILVFLDADVRLNSTALESLISEREERGGALSVVPFHVTEKFYETLALLPNLLGAFAFVSPFEKKNPRKGLYGSCIVVDRENYEKVGGHQAVCSETLDDLQLGARFSTLGIPVHNYLGTNQVLFRMYPNGLKSEWEGFSKGALQSTTQLSARTVFFIALWFVGLLTAEISLFLGWSLGPIFLLGYLLFTFQILWINRSVGSFGWLVPLCHLLSTLFFLGILFSSFYQLTIRKSITWKGRRIPARQKAEPRGLKDSRKNRIKTK